jgi:hypothetical protein
MKVKFDLHVGSVLCLSGLNKPPPLFGVVDNFSTDFSLSTTPIDRFFTSNDVVDNFYPYQRNLWIKYEKPLQCIVLFDIIILFSLWINNSINLVIHRLWITCGQVIQSLCKTLSTGGGYCRNTYLLPYYIFFHIHRDEYL